jgi:dihydroxy-acid dehydratase
VDLSNDELARRRAEWTAPIAPQLTPVFAKYAALVGSASTGATCSAERRG